MARTPASGFSLLELLVSIAIIAITLMLGIPSLSRQLADAALRADSSALSVALASARMRAVENASGVTVCPRGSDARCAPGTDWSRGWLVFDDPGLGGQPASPQAVRESARLDANQRSVTSTTGRPRVSFRRDGSSAGSNVTLTLCDPRHPGLGRQIVVNNVGRTRAGPLPAGWTCARSLR